jgi:putative ABC transport system permease protein
MIWEIAWKNIWRNKQRSLIVIFSMAIGLLGGTFTAALVFGMRDQKINASVNYEVSHIQIHQPKYLENNETQYSINNTDSIVSDISGIPGVKSVAKRTKVIGMISYSSFSSGVQIIGVNPDEEKRTTSIYKTICDSCGTYFETAKKNPVVISLKLANKLKARLHSKIVLRFPKTEGDIQTAAFNIVGIYHTSNTAFDETNVFVRNKDLSDSSGPFFKTHEIAVLLNNNDSLVSITSKIKAKYPQLSVMTWKEIQPQLAILEGFVGVELYVILGIILFALAFGIVNTMLMVVFERVRELGMLMAIGMNKAKIFKMIMLETLLLTLTGGVVGMILSGILLLSFGNKGLDLSSVSKGMEALGYEAVIYPRISVAYYLNLSLMIIVTGILSSIYPSRKALKLRPAEAVRAE